LEGEEPEHPNQQRQPELGAAEADEPAETPTPAPAANAAGSDLGRVGMVMTELAAPSADGRVTVSPLHVGPSRRFGPVPLGIILAVLSLAVMPTLAFAKQRVGNQMGGRALVADSKETWVCSYLSLSLLLGVGAYALVGWWWADPVGALAMLPIILWQGWETLAEARERADRED
jgi:hypothetical protein